MITYDKLIKERVKIKIKIFNYEIEIKVIRINKIEKLTVDELRAKIEYELRDEIDSEIEVVISKSWVNPLKDSFQKEYEKCIKGDEDIFPKEQNWYKFRVESYSFKKVRMFISN